MQLINTFNKQKQNYTKTIEWSSKVGRRKKQFCYFVPTLLSKNSRDPPKTEQGDSELEQGLGFIWLDAQPSAAAS